ncbi:MAG: RNA-binding protein [candidate division WOR-3 bacterium]
MPEKCKCPFCDSELLMKCFEPIFCTNCNVELIICPECRKLFNIKFEKCPHCGKKNERRKE